MKKFLDILDSFFCKVILWITVPYWIPRLFIEFKKKFGSSIWSDEGRIRYNSLTEQEKDDYMEETVKKIVNFRWG